MFRHRLSPALALTVAALTGCAEPPPVEGPAPDAEELAHVAAEHADAPTGESAHALYGDVHYANRCTASERQFLDETMQYGRIAAASDAFASCVDTAMRVGIGNVGPYRQCDGDPFFGQTLDTQIAKAIETAQSLNDVWMDCAGGSGNASTGLGDHGHDDDERFWWGSWFRDILPTLDEPLCSTGAEPCRWAPEPWPFSQAAGISWHEVMHTHGYTHGANDQANAKVACGYAGTADAFFHFQRNTLPYIVGSCLDRVIWDSASVCGAVDSGCGEGELRLMDDWGSNSCTCVHDPRMEGLGLMALDADRELEATDQVSPADRMGSWNYGTGDELVGHGDFDGDGRDELLIRSGWGFGMIGGASSNLSADRIYAWGARIDGWVLDADDSMTPIGDVDGDGHADILVRSGWGLGVLGYAGGRLRMHAASPWYRWLGNYYARPSDVIVGSGDFDGDGRHSLLVQGWHGLARLELSNGALGSPEATVAQGQRMGGWLYNRSDDVVGIGDFDGDGADEFAIRSGWGLGFIDFTARFTSIRERSFGSTLLYIWSGRTSWVLDANDTFPAVADLNGDGADELVVFGPTHIGALSIYAGDIRTRTRYADATMLSGGWRVHTDDTVEAVANLDGHRGEELVVTSGWGLGVLSFGNNNYTFIAHDLTPFGRMAGTWLLDAGDAVYTAGDLNGDGREVFLLERD